MGLGYYPRHQNRLGCGLMARRHGYYPEHIRCLEWSLQHCSYGRWLGLIAVCGGEGGLAGSLDTDGTTPSNLSYTFLKHLLVFSHHLHGGSHQWIVPILLQTTSWPGDPVALQSVLEGTGKFLSIYIRSAALLSCLEWDCDSVAVAWKFDRGLCSVVHSAVTYQMMVCCWPLLVSDVLHCQCRCSCCSCLHYSGIPCSEC